MTIEFDGVVYEKVYREESIDKALDAQAKGEHALVQRQCVACGDALLQLPDHLVEGATCEEGYCGTRSGVSYVNAG